MRIEEIDELRLRPLNNAVSTGTEDVIYLMSREQRIDENWALIHALNLAYRYKRGVRIVHIMGAYQPIRTKRSLDFKIKGLQEVEKRASGLAVPFELRWNADPADVIREICGKNSPAAVICDFNPLRESISGNSLLAASLDVPVIEVDGHNIVPCRVASDKQEYGAFTLRRKIEQLLPRFLTPFPDVEVLVKRISDRIKPAEGKTDWQKLLDEMAVDESVDPVKEVEPGYDAGMSRLGDFLEAGLDAYDKNRNDPSLSAQSGLSPYLHFGQISPQFAVLQAAGIIGGLPLKGGFLDEIIVRRELSDNFCLYNPYYDSSECFPAWAVQSLGLHAFDKREYLYTLDELEKGSTHDRLWNAAQNQMVKSGVMHGYMRMYWAKKILEWSPDAAEAMKRAVYLNDRYSLDGCDPNGYAGCAWSVGGVHDRAWTDRPVFGKVRYMNYRGCRRKFDTEKYIGMIGE